MKIDLLKKRVRENLDDYGDVFFMEESNTYLVLRDGKGNKFKIDISKIETNY